MFFPETINSYAGISCKILAKELNKLGSRSTIASDMQGDHMVCERNKHYIERSRLAIYLYAHIFGSLHLIMYYPAPDPMEPVSRDLAMTPSPLS